MGDKDLNDLFGLDALEDPEDGRSIVGREWFFRAIRHAADTILEEGHEDPIVIQVPITTAYQIANDLEFAFNAHPLGLPDDENGGET